MTPPRLVPLLAQFDFACHRLADRLAGPTVDSGSGALVDVATMDDDEYFWEPVGYCWSIRRRAEGPGPGATMLVGAGEWGRDTAAPEHPLPPPFTTIAWRLGHLVEMLTVRADHTVGGHCMTRDDVRFAGRAREAIAAFDAAAAAWRTALTSADDATLDQVGYCTYPHGNDSEEPFVQVVWWVNQEVLHHGAEIALLRDLRRSRGRRRGPAA